MNQALTDDVALRLGLAARALPESGVRGLLRALLACLGPPLTLERLATLRFDILHAHLTAETDAERIKEAVRLLKDHQPITLTEAESPPAPRGELLENAVRIACASNGGARLDGHFGSCVRFLIYDVNGAEIRLIDVRTPGQATIDNDANLYRAHLIRDCHLLAVLAIGGPAAAKVTKMGLMPMKVTQEWAHAEEFLAQVRETMAHDPPPWLTRQGRRAL